MRAAGGSRSAEPWLIAVTLLVVPVLILQASEVDEPWETIATVGDWGIWLAFVAELIVMLAIVPNRRRWLAQHPLDVAIVILTPPFGTAVLQSVRLLRLLRVVRLLRVASLARSVFAFGCALRPQAPRAVGAVLALGSGEVPGRTGGFGVADPVVEDLAGEPLHELGVHVATP